MPATPSTLPYICAHCSRASRPVRQFAISDASLYRASIRRFANGTGEPQEADRKDETQQDTDSHGSGRQKKEDDNNEGAMTRRLRAMSEESLETGGNRKTISEAGFSEDLRKQLEERIASANFRAENRNAFAEAELPSHAARHSRDIATAEPWTGQESIHDASLRMLNDAHKPLRFKGSRGPGPAPQMPRSIDTGRKTGGAGSGFRLANARDRSGLYSSVKDADIDEAERQKRFQELKDRFSPHARSIVPGTIQGLASLANERIEDAIARGQFKNLPRGQKIERDYNASNPFLDTTEYFMNKMIQKQDIVPPWIEKQQELVATASKFRSRLRSDWKRHAARMIASKGGTLQEQIRRAEAYAKAELIANPKEKKRETLNAVDESGHVSQISLSGELRVPADLTRPVVEEVVAEKTEIGATPTPDSSTDSASTHTVTIPLQPPATTDVPPAPYPFRDPAWESTESSYHKLAIEDLNSKTRSYNLQAPDLAKKPYFSLSREMSACFADVAPQLAEAIRDRASKPQKTQGFGDALAGKQGIMNGFVGTGHQAKVRDERVEKQYGFRQFWKDVWGG